MVWSKGLDMAGGRKRLVDVGQLSKDWLGGWGSGLHTRIRLERDAAGRRLSAKTRAWLVGKVA